jgi:hypothetical protein
VQEFAFRLNEGNVSRHTIERLDSFIAGVGRQAADLSGVDPPARRRKREANKLAKEK